MVDVADTAPLPAQADSAWKVRSRRFFELSSAVLSNPTTVAGLVLALAACSDDSDQESDETTRSAESGGDDGSDDTTAPGDTGADDRAEDPDDADAAARVLSRVVAITFTEAAAAEMATRVEQALRAVERDEEILLGRSSHFPAGIYSVLAGFVEPGESVEEAVVREVREEANVECDEVEYFGSQPWPYPNSLMLGFRARYKSGDIRCGDGELEDAQWFRHDDMPTFFPGNMSISQWLIQDFLHRHRR